jgi:hypothetical protein
MNHGNNDVLKNLDENVSWSIWFKPSGAGTNRTLFSKWYANSNDRAWLLRLQADGTFSFWISGTGALSSGAFGRWLSVESYDDGQWHFLTVSHNRLEIPRISFYVDGVASTIDVNTSYGGLIYRSNALVSLGAQSQSSASRLSFWNGNMDDFRILNTMTLAEHTSIYNATKDYYI